MSKYDDLPRDQLIELLNKRDRTKRLGLVWERDEIEADNAVDANFVAATLVPNLCDKAEPWKNLVIEGDNFDALRWLRMTYPEGIKCIYIDPPYNTGNKDWVYNDHYIDKEDRYRHSTWLEFLFRRLILARDLLSEDGILIVSINDDQRAKLELLMDEALPGMRIGSLVWRTRTGGNEGGDRFFTGNHEHLLIYSKGGFRFGGTQKTFEKYSNHDDDHRGDWRDDNLTVSVAYNDKRAGKAYYPLQDPSTGIWYPCNPDRVWAYVSKIHSPNARIKTKYMEEFIADGQVLFPDEQEVQIWENQVELEKATNNSEVPRSRQTLFISPDLPGFDFWIGKKVGFGTPRFKRFKKDLKYHNQPLSSWVTPKSEKETKKLEENSIISGTNDEGSKSVKAVFGTKAFNYAKPTSLIREIVRQSSAPGDTILDFFAGSATTAHAVMELNAEGMGDRNFIMVSSTEGTAEEPEKNLCRDVTAERIRLINSSDDPRYAGMSAEFAYLRCDEIDFEDLDQDLTAQQIWSIIEAMNKLPLTEYSKGFWQEHRTDELTLIFADKVSDDLISHLKVITEKRENAIVYSWAPGQIIQHLGQALDVRNVRDEMVNRFRQ